MAEDYTDYITQGAIARGLNPKDALHTVDTEGGRSGKVGDSGTSFGPFQMHVGGTAPGTTAKGLGDAMLAQGLDPKNPYQSIDFALDYAKAHGGFSPDIWHGLRSGGGLAPGEHRWVGAPSGGGDQPLYLGTLEKNFHQPTGNDLLDALLNLNVPKEDKPTGNDLLDHLLLQSMSGMGAPNQAQPAPDAAKALGRIPQALPPQTVPELSGQQVDIKPMQPLQQASMAVPPYLPQGQEEPGIIAPAPRERDYPQDDEYGHIPKEGPALTPVRPFQQPPATGNGLLDRILKQLSPISAAQAGEPTPSAQQGMIPGNIDLHARPIVRNPDGSISTVRSMSFNEDGKEILIPTVAADGSGILSDKQAIEQYHRTGQFLGKFDTPAEADAYAQKLHEDQDREYTPKQFIEPPAKGQQVPMLAAPQTPAQTTAPPPRLQVPPGPMMGTEPGGLPPTANPSDIIQKLIDWRKAGGLAGSLGMEPIEQALANPTPIQNPANPADLAKAALDPRGLETATLMAGINPESLGGRIEPPPIGGRAPAGEMPSEALAPKQPEISPPATPPGAPPPPPGTPASPSPPTPPPPKSPARQAYDTFMDKAQEAVRDAQIKVVPMAAGNEVTQAIGKEFAVSEQHARYRRMEWDRKLREIPEGDRRAMWEAMDHASVAAQYTGRYEDGMRYLNMLPAEQRDLLMDMENKGIDLWEQARAAGVVAEDAERLPFYIMRGIVRLTDEGTAARVGSDLGMRPRGVNPIGTNLRTRGPQGRQYLTSEETIAAARQRFGPGAQLVKDIRALPLAYEKLEMATAGRNMVNDIKAIGDASGKELVSEGQAKPGFFTMDHPAMFRSRPRFQTNAEGKVVPVLDEAGNIVFDRVPIYISREFEGPLRAVLRTPTGPLYRGAMMMKGGVMSLVLNSPMIHNQVIWGKALPAAPGKVASFAIYREGNKLMQDPKFMEEAIRNGMIPIGERGYLTDIEGIAGADDLKPGRSLTSKALGFPAEWIAGPNAGTAVRQAIDKAGDFWHYRLLWKQIGKLQAGLYQTFKDRLVAKGFDEKAAGVAAAHFANRYAGVLPNEAMSAMARKALNMVLFSRSFTVGNLGILKDMINGLPQDARAIASSSLDQLQKKALTSMARRKAIGVVATDLTMLYVGLALAQNAVDVLNGDKTIGAEAHDYVDRFNALLHRGKEHWSELLNPFNDLLALSPMYEHEPGKEFRIKVGTDEKGTGIYVRLPAGKFAEETMGWVTSTAPQLRNKLGFIARPIINLLANDNGLGQHIYNKEAAGASGVAKNIGNILWEFMRADIPELQIKGAMDFLTGQDRSLFSGLQAAGPLIGTTASHGYPGGPQAGKNALLKREVQDIRKQMYDLARHRTPENAARTNELIKGLQEDLRDREQEWLRRYPPPPKVGERGPMGGIVTHQESYQQPATQ